MKALNALLDNTHPAFPEPELCDACRSSNKMNYVLVSVQSGYQQEKKGVPAWVCDECGHVHLKTKKPSKPTERGYNDKLDADEQVSAEECIAATIFDHLETEGCDGCGTLSEEDCAKLGRDILKKMLQQFRPDLFD